MIDSGADDNFIDSELVTYANIPVPELESLKTVTTLGGRLLATIIHQTAPLTLSIPGNHHETIQSFMLPSPSSPVVLCLPWLKKHNPHDWSQSNIISWSLHCHSHCLLSALTNSSGLPCETPEPPDLSMVYVEYHTTTLFTPI